MLIIITRSVHIGACLILLSLFDIWNAHRDTGIEAGWPKCCGTCRSSTRPVSMAGGVEWSLLCKIFACLKDYLRLGRPVFLAQARHV